MKKIYHQLEEYLTYCKKVRKMSEVTLKTKRYILLRFIKGTNLRNLQKLTNQIFDAYVTSLIQDGASGRSVNVYNATIVTFVKYHQDLGLAAPFKTILVRKLNEAKIERKFYTSEENKRVIKTADRKTGLIVRIMFETGM